MRLPVVPQISTKDGISNKNARLTNCLKEVKKSGEKAVVRPGLVLDDTYTGVGSGLIPFDGRLLVIYDDTVYDTTLDNSRPWELDALPWDAGTNYSIGDVIICNGVIKFSMANGNIGNACNDAGTTYWSTSSSTDTYVATDTYAIGDTVVYDGVTYYSWRDGNVGNTPSSSPLDWRTTAPNSNYTISNIVYTPPYPKPFPGSTSATWDIMNGAVVVGTGSGTYTSTYDSGTGIARATASNWPNTEPIVGFPRPASPPGTIFSGSTEWSGNVGWTNYAWFPAQSSGSWYAVG